MQKEKKLFYDKKALLELLNKSNVEPNIKSYIQQEKINLYNEPNDNDSTDIYIIKNDMVKILDVIWADEQHLRVWFKVSYNSKQNGKIIKWIKGDSFTIW